MKPLWAALGLAAGLFAQDIDPRSLEASVRFLSSRELGGRGAPSEGLDVAARYLATEFFRIGLEPGAGDSYFQDVKFLRVSPRGETAALKITGAEEASVRVRSLRAVQLEAVSLFKWTPSTKVDGTLTGKVLILRPTKPEMLAKLELAKPDAVIEVVRADEFENFGPTALVPVEDRDLDRPPTLVVRMSDLEDIYDRLPEGLTKARVTLHVAAPELTDVVLKNVAGVLRGSDPLLRDECVLVTAHYDHLGLTAEGLFPGANDDASGTASLLAIAEALATSGARPKRTLVFIALTAEEAGLLGSRYYVRHPLRPLNKTVADINLEQLGRLDDEGGLGRGKLGVAGFGYSTLGSVTAEAMNATGVELGELRHGDEYFARSDHYSFAEAGVPAVTFVAAWEFPDYHRPTDTFDKLDYPNMARLDRAITAAVRAVADRAEPPKWNESEKKARSFAEKWRAMHR